MARERVGSPWRSREESSLLLGTVLWLVDRLRGAFTAFGIDYPIFRELLRVRVLVSLRPATSSASSWGLAGIVIAVVVTWLMGLVTGLIALLSTNTETWVVVSQSALLVLLCLVLFQQLAGILVDPTDIGVVAAHPVSDRTVFAVRMTEVFAFLLIFVLSFTAGNVLLAVFKKPPLVVLLVYPLLSLLCGLTTLGIVALLFALCLRIVGPTHFQRVTLWAQILGGCLVFGTMQLPRLVPRLLPREDGRTLLEGLDHLRFLWPPFQYAGLFDLASGDWNRENLLASVGALLLPLLALAITFRLASRYFVAGLQGTLSTGTRGPVGWTRMPFSWLADRLARPREERAGFDFTLALTRREPHFLRGVLPQLLMFQFMSLGAAFGRHGSELPFSLPMSAGFLFMVLPNILMLSQGTPMVEASWVFASTPLESENSLLRGGVKALLVQWIGLPAAVLFCVQLFLGGPAALPGILLAFELSFATVLIFVRLFQLGIPFTRAIRTGETGAANIGLIIVMGLAFAVLVAIHVLLSLHPLALWAGIVACAAALVALWRRVDALRVAKDRRLQP